MTYQLSISFFLLCTFVRENYWMSKNILKSWTNKFDKWYNTNIAYASLASCLKHPALGSSDDLKKY